MIHILIAEDHPVVRRGLHSVLAAERDLCIVGEANDGLHALDLLTKSKPDVLITDLMMPRLNGLELIKRVRRESPFTRSIVMTLYENAAYVSQAFSIGALGYILKNDQPEAIIQAVRSVVEGQCYLSQALAESEIDFLGQEGRQSEGDTLPSLTRREREILHLSAKGKTSAQVAYQLSISPRTVEVHRQHLMHKLGLRNQTDLVRYALQQGILPSPNEANV